jgi:hypothetical protein
MDTAMKWFARAADRGDFAATQQCRMWMRGPSVADEDIRDQRYAEVAAREDYQAIMRRLRLDDESVADLLDAYPGERL